MARNVALLILRGIAANIPSLNVGEFYFATDTKQVFIGTASGNQSLTSGRFLARTILTSGTSFTTGSFTHQLRTYLQGAGGGGGGVSSAASSGAMAGGGSSGAYAEKLFAVSPNTAYGYNIGVGGLGGAVGNNPGSSATNSTTFTVGATTVTAGGGFGGGGMAAGTVVAYTPGSAIPLAINGDVNVNGTPGFVGIRNSAAIGKAGAGGSCRYGIGGLELINTTAPGSLANGFGSGGGGASNISNGGAQKGGNGAPAIIIVEEYS